MSDVTVELRRVDWRSLRKQKLSLYEMVLRLKEDGGTERSEHLRGILHFLDHVQDEAARVLGERVVFGKLQSD